MESRREKKNIITRFLQWLEKANKNALEKGSLCGS
jgi:hypothetical protein